MIEALCGDCGKTFTAIVVLGITSCSHCGSSNTYVAVEGKPKKRAKEKGK